MGRIARLLFIVLAALILWSVWVFSPPTWVFPATFVVIFLFYSNTLRERVPLFLSNRTTWLAVSELMKSELKQNIERPQLIDLGCGLGGGVSFLARNHPNWDVFGVETAPGPYLVSKIRVAFVPNAHIRFQSLWVVNLGAFDVVYAFLSPAPMARLCQKIHTEMKPNTLFISNSFWADEEPYDRDVLVNDARESHLFCKQL